MPTRVTGKLEREALGKAGEQAAARQVFTDTRRVFNRARVLSPYDTGLLRANHTIELKVNRARRRAVGRVTVSVKYALAVHEGSGPYVIRPTKKQALRFRYKGRIVIVKSVNHPGVQSRPWLYTALTEVAAGRGYIVTRDHPKTA